MDDSAGCSGCMGGAIFGIVIGAGLWQLGTWTMQIINLISRYGLGG